MGDRHIYKCPKCGDEIYVGGGINDGEDGKITCPSCKCEFRLIKFLIPFDATSYTTGYGYRKPRDLCGGEDETA
jgi:DNA-directed RNA polymerase subunit RPC12/RpoP